MATASEPFSGDLQEDRLQPTHWERSSPEGRQGASRHVAAHRLPPRPPRRAPLLLKGLHARDDLRRRPAMAPEREASSRPATSAMLSSALHTASVRRAVRSCRNTSRKIAPLARGLIIRRHPAFRGHIPRRIRVFEHERLKILGRKRVNDDVALRACRVEARTAHRCSARCRACRLRRVYRAASRHPASRPTATPCPAVSRTPDGGAAPPATGCIRWARETSPVRRARAQEGRVADAVKRRVPLQKVSDTVADGTGLHDCRLLASSFVPAIGNNSHVRRLYERSARAGSDPWQADEKPRLSREKAEREEEKTTGFAPGNRRFCLMPYPFSLVGGNLSATC